MRRSGRAIGPQARERQAVDALGIVGFAREIGVEVGDLRPALDHARVGAQDVGELAVQADRDGIFDLGVAQHGAVYATHDEFEVRDVVLLVFTDHQKFALRVRGAVQAITAVEHENLERGHAEFVDQHVDLADVRAIERREVISVIDPEVVLRGRQHLGIDLGVGTAALHVIATGTHVIEARGHAALRRRQALAASVRGQRPVNASVHMRVDQARKRQFVFAVDDFTRLSGGNALGQLHHLAIGDGNVEFFDGGFAWTHHAHVLDQQVVFLGLLGHGAPVGKNRLELCRRRQSLEGLPKATSTLRAAGSAHRQPMS